MPRRGRDVLQQLASRFRAMNLFVPNLNFEDELAGRGRPMTSQLNRVLNELAPLIGLLAEGGDLVQVNDDAMPEVVPECLAHARFVSRSEASADGGQQRIIPWGWTEQTRHAALKVKMSPTEIPAAEAVTLVNSRDFSSRFDVVACDRADLLPFGDSSFGVICRNTGEWECGVRQLAQAGFRRWVAKPQISHAGRNRLLANGTELNAQQRGWLNKHLAQSGSVYLEPWVRPDEECGLQFEIIPPIRKLAATGDRIRLLGVSGLTNDAVGRYQGSLIRRDDLLTETWRLAVTHGFAVCEAAAAAGYFGPIGLDAFRFRLPNGSRALRLCNDVNARFTMGRLALQLRPSLQSFQCGAWCQFAVADFSQFCDAVQKGLAQSATDDVNMTVTSPHSVGGQSTSIGTLLFAGDSPARLLRLVKSIRDQAASRHDGMSLESMAAPFENLE